MADRKSADDRSNMNKIYKPIAGYVANVVKEYRQWDGQVNAPARGPATGQFYGALLQGRRYDDKTGKQITKPEIKKSNLDTNPKGLKKMDLDKKAKGKK